jgi:hypothetical protein
MATLPCDNRIVWNSDMVEVTMIALQVKDVLSSYSSCAKLIVYVKDEW